MREQVVENIRLAILRALESHDTMCLDNSEERETVAAAAAKEVCVPLMQAETAIKALGAGQVRFYANAIAEDIARAYLGTGPIVEDRDPEVES